MNLDSKIVLYQNKLNQVVIDYNRFNLYAITHHSTAIEGSTLTLTETELLLAEDLTTNKPFLHHLMVKDHYEALQFILSEENIKKEITIDFIQKVNALVMKNTGNVVKTILGDYDVSKGEFRKTSIVASKHISVDAKKIVPMMQKVVSETNLALKTAKSNVEKYQISFDFHFNLMSIHPFGDGNGRTSRLLMNYIQDYFDLPLSIIFNEDKAQYIEALNTTRKQEDITIFRTFMLQQLDKYLDNELQKLNSESKIINKIKGLSYIF